MRTKVVVKSFSMQEDWFLAVKAAAEREKVSLGHWIGSQLPASVRENLSPRRGQGRPKKEKEEG